MNKRISLTKILLSLVIIIALGLSTFNLNAKFINLNEALSETTEFLNSNASGRLKSPAVDSELKCAYTAKSGDLILYYIFNFESGFIITSADTRLPSILGYSFNGCFDEKNLPSNFKWWLNEYSREISSFLPSAPESFSNMRSHAKVSRPEILPMIKTKWNQDAPYNNECPTVSGYKSVTGCVATAVAQLMKYWEWPLRPTGSNAGVIFNGTVYDWKNMIDEYRMNDYTSTQANAVAKLMRQVGAAVNMQYSPYGSGAYDVDVQIAMPKYFDYNQGMFFHWKDYTPLKEWINIVYSELAAGRPIYYTGSSDEGGHAFVCDGYDKNDYFHFNWGWGGYQDGYFLLTALNPAAGGAGSYEGGYNRSQAILTGFMPANNPEATTKKQVALIATGDFVYLGDNIFGIANSSIGVDLIYNPLGYSVTVDVGVKIVDVNNPEKVIYQQDNSDTYQSYTGFPGYYSYLPSLPDGEYKIYSIYREKGSAEWKNVLIPIGRQNCVNLTIKNGVATYTNEGPDDDSNPYLIVGQPDLPPVLYGDTDVVFHLPIVNVGKGDFSSEIGVTISDANDEFGDMLLYNETISLASESFLNLEVAMTGVASPGDYLLSVMDSSGKIYINDYKLIISNTNLSTDPKATLSASNISPNFYTSGTESPIYFTLYSNSPFEAEADIAVELLDYTNLKPIKELHGAFHVSLNGGVEKRFNITPFNFDIKPGFYLYRFVDNSSRQPISLPVPIIVESPICKTTSGLNYIVTDEQNKLAVLTAPEDSSYKGSITVPTELDGYKINSIRQDAFAFFGGESVTLPTTISELPNGAFYAAKKLNSLTLNSPLVVDAASETFDSKLTEKYWLDIPSNLISEYLKNSIWQTFNLPSWTMNLNESTISKGLEGIYNKNNVYYPGSNYPFILSLSNSKGMNIKIVATINGKQVAESIIPSGGPGISIPALGKIGKGIITATLTTEPAGIEEISTDSDSPANIYSIDGVIIKKNATKNELSLLKKGVYIYKNQKYIIR